jgi:hypothetical protein
MRAWWRKAWPVLKVLFVVVLLVAVGRLIVRDVQQVDLRQHPLHPAWLGTSAILYLLGLGLSAWFWYHLLRVLGQHPPGWASVRAYYIGHLGKYLPGKAWALLLRTTLIRGPGVRLSVAGLTTFYEVLATMASGVLLAAAVFCWQVPDWGAGLDWDVFLRIVRLQLSDLPPLDARLAMLLSLGMLLPVGLPLLPPIFNRVAYRLTRRLHDPDASPLPPTRWTHLLQGLLLTSVGWLLLGASFWATLRAVLGPALPWSGDGFARYTAYLALSYVAGFVLGLPAGLGVRELLLLLFLVPDLAALPGGADSEARVLAGIAVAILRLVWTVAEVVIAGVLYWLPGPALAAVGDSS